MSLYCKARRTLLLRPPQHHTWLGIGLGLGLGVGLGLGFGIHKARVRVRPQLHVPKQRWLSWRCLASASARSAAEASLAMPALNGVITREYEPPPWRYLPIYGLIVDASSRYIRLQPLLHAVAVSTTTVAASNPLHYVASHTVAASIPYNIQRALIGLANSRAKNGSAPSRPGEAKETRA